MKKIIYKMIGIVMMFIIVLPSCKKGFEEINTDPNGAPDATPAQLLAPALRSTLHVNMIRNRNFNNELMQVTVSLSDGDATVFRYEFRRTLSDYLWNSWYIQLTNLKDMYSQASEITNTSKASYQGISLISQAWVYSLLTDTYGDVPYFESNMAKEGNVEPAFDRQKDIYLDIFKKLEEANTLLTGAPNILASSDPVYNGVVSNWRRFGNSLYLRLLLRVSGKSEVSADVIAKIQEIIGNSSTYPIMTSNSQSAILKWTGMAPYISPFMSVRAQDFRSPGLASFFIDHLRDWADPRIDISTYGSNGVNRWGISQGSNGFSGVPSGYVPGTGVSKQSDFYSYEERATSLQNDQLTGILMNYAEVQFILAEAAAKGWITGSAETYWKNGILNDITYWLPNWPNPTALATPPSPSIKIDSPEFIKYMSDADISWGTAPTLDEQMEKIHLHKYYALFLVDLQQWFEFRRTGHPVLPKGAGLRNNGVMPARMTYPVYVESANPTNYKIAVAEQGPDEIYTQVWWQKP